MKELIGEAWHRSPEKRRMDLALAVGVMPVALVSTGIAASSIAVSTGDRPYFRQTRNHGQEQIEITKLKTYRGLPTSMSRNAARQSRVELVPGGRIMRKSRIDEFPQLALIFRGDMSMVGPRALVPSEYEETMDLLSPDEQNELTMACKITRPGLIYPKPRKIAERGAPPPRERVFDTIEYAYKGSRMSDLEAMREYLTLVRGALRHGLSTIAD